ncbi:hypothetical protein Tco_1114664 [Tanacetum coccineum]|uniref:Uncharacterized protein n=1 Tax=Tanacetum coccineum TaxID=301880 RepID=A0ABQ5IWU8_9ASTR
MGLTSGIRAKDQRSLGLHCSMGGHELWEFMARFGGNEATKKTQKALLKQQYENFSASSLESLDSIFNRLQRLVSRLAILGVVTPPEDLNVKFLRSLPSKWDTHVKVKKSAGANNDDKNLAFVTTSGASKDLEEKIIIDGSNTAGYDKSKVDKDWKEKLFCPANHVREEQPKKAREKNDAPIIEDWVSDDEDEVEPIPGERKLLYLLLLKKEVY